MSTTCDLTTIFLNTQNSVGAIGQSHTLLPGLAGRSPPQADVAGFSAGAVDGAAPGEPQGSFTDAEAGAVLAGVSPHGSATVLAESPQPDPLAFEDDSARTSRAGCERVLAAPHVLCDGGLSGRGRLGLSSGQPAFLRGAGGGGSGQPVAFGLAGSE